MIKCLNKSIVLPPSKFNKEYQQQVVHNTINNQYQSFKNKTPYDTLLFFYVFVYIYTL